MGTPDSGEYAGQTRFLDRTALNDQTAFGNRINIGLRSDVTSVILMTDGISDPRFETDNGLLDSSGIHSGTRFHLTLQVILPNET